MKKINIHKLKIIKNKQKGVVVLLAVLVAVLLLSIATTIVSIALRQTILSSTGRESQYAFYAADTALECALYWDLNPPAPASDEPQAYVFPVVDPLGQSRATGSFMCSGDDISVGWDTSIANETTIQFIISSDITDQDFCATATVIKEYDNTNNLTTTTIQSRGYNSSTCGFSSPRTVERGLELSYTS